MLNDLYRRYGDRVAFYVVYIEEAHPIDAWQLDDNLEDAVLIANPTSEIERAAVAGVCLTKLGINLPALVDRADDRVERAYTGWPDRLYVIDVDGKIAYKSEAGPFGFKPAQVDVTLQRIIPATQSAGR